MNDDTSQNPNPQHDLPEEPQNQQAQNNQTPPPPPGGSSASRSRQPVQTRTIWWPLPVGIAVGCLPWTILFFLLIAAIIGGASGIERGNHVALIKVSGVITGGSSGGGVFGGSAAGSEDLVAALEKARKDKGVKAIVLRINSPGGSAAGSEEVYNAIMRVRKSGKPVYTSMGDVAASGGYYIAAACNRIYADANTLTGSIGVIMETADMSELFNKIGFNPQTIKSGKFKDIGSPNRPLSPDERELLQGMIMDIYNNFVKAVADGRNMPVDQVKQLADGRVFTGGQALEAKLVDEIGGMDKTVKDAAKAGGISGEPRVIEYGKRRWIESMFGDAEGASGRIEREVSKEVIERLLRSGSEIGNLR